MKTGAKQIWCVLAILALGNVVNAEGESVAFQLAKVDAGKWKEPTAVEVARIGSLLGQLTERFQMEELTVADKVVFVTHKLLRDRYGVQQTLQNTMEDLNRVRMTSIHAGDFEKLAVVYAQLRNTGQSRSEAVTRLNIALVADPRALDKILGQ